METSSRKWSAGFWRFEKKLGGEKGKWSERQDLNLSKAVVLSGNSQGDAQIDAQSLIPLGRDLARVVTVWSKLSSPLKAAILAIVNSSEDIR
jgi:hypothetical protein